MSRGNQYTDIILRSSSGVRIAARECGPSAAEPLILLGGWPQTLHAWREVQGRFANCGFRTIAMDPPGLGGSDMLDRTDAYSTTSVAGVLTDALSEHGVERCALVGHDVGAWIAFAWATRSPLNVSKVALLDAAIPGAFPDEIFTIANAARTFQFFFNAVPELPEILTTGRERAFLEWLFKTKATVKGAITAADIDIYLRCYEQPEHMSAGFEYYRAVPTSIKALEGGDRLAMPVLALGAEHGVGEALEKALAPHCLDLEGGVIKGSGHFIPEEAPEALISRLLAFCGSPNS